MRALVPPLTLAIPDARLRTCVLALAVVVGLAGCLNAEPPAQDEPRNDTQTDEASLRPITQQFKGTALGSPAQPGVYEFPFDVPRGAVGVNGTLAWGTPGSPIPSSARFELELVDPDGEVVARGYRDVEDHLIVVTVEPPKPGTWIFRVRATLAANTSFTLDAVAELIVPEQNVAAKTVNLGQGSFYEVNLILEKDASFRFSFNASSPLKWDIHSHPPEGLKEWETGEGTTGSAEFHAPTRDVYSIMWENGGALPADLSFEVVGKFRIHSHSG